MRWLASIAGVLLASSVPASAGVVLSCQNQMGSLTIELDVSPTEVVLTGKEGVFRFPVTSYADSPSYTPRDGGGVTVSRELYWVEFVDRGGKTRYLHMGPGFYYYEGSPLGRSWVWRCM